MKKIVVVSLVVFLLSVSSIYAINRSALAASDDRIYIPPKEVFIEPEVTTEEIVSEFEEEEIEVEVLEEVEVAEPSKDAVISLKTRVIGSDGRHDLIRYYFEPESLSVDEDFTVTFESGDGLRHRVACYSGSTRVSLTEDIYPDKPFVTSFSRGTYLCLDAIYGARMELVIV